MWYEPALPIHLSPAVRTVAAQQVAPESSSPAAGASQAADTFTSSPADVGPSSSNIEQSPAQPRVGDLSPGPCEVCGWVLGW